MAGTLTTPPLIANRHRWRSVPLSGVLQSVSSAEVPIPGVEYRQVGVKWWGNGVYEREAVDGANTQYKRFARLRAGQVIINKIWARHGSVAVVPKELEGCFASSEFPTFEPDANELDPRWIHWLTKTKKFWAQCDEKSRGTSGKNRIRPEQFLEIAISLPPLPEQRRIVARVEELAVKVEEAKSIRLATNQAVEALLAAARHRAFRSRSSWREMRVSELCEHPQYGYTASATTVAVGPKLLRITDIQDGQVDWSSVPFCSCNEPDKYILQPNDILFARTGATTGKSFLIHQCPNAVFASYLIRLRIREQVTARYLYEFFQSPYYWEQITDQRKGTGQPNVNGKKLGELKVPVPPPADQERIVAHLEEVGRQVRVLRQDQAKVSAELDALLPSILDKAFKGEL